MGPRARAVLGLAWPLPRPAEAMSPWPSEAEMSPQPGEGEMSPQPGEGELSPQPGEGELSPLLDHGSFPHGHVTSR